MVVTLSDYILEQEVSVSAHEDIVMEQLQAEIDVATRLIDAYSKQAIMLEYAACYYQEETETAAKPNIFKRIGAALKKAWDAFIGLLKRLFGKVAKFVTGGTAKQVAKKLEDLTDEEKRVFKVELPRDFEDMTAIFATYTDYANEFLDQMIDAAHIELTDDAAVSKAVKKIGELSDEYFRQVKKIGDSGMFGRPTAEGEETPTKTLNYDEALAAVKSFAEGAAAKGLREKLAEFEQKMGEGKKAIGAFPNVGMPELITGDTAETAHARDEEQAKRINKAQSNYTKISNEISKFLGKFSKMAITLEKDLEDSMTKLIKAASSDAKKRAAENADIVARAKATAPEASPKGVKGRVDLTSDPYQYNDPRNL